MSKARSKRVGIGARPPPNPQAEAWIRQGDADTLNKGDLYTARLTLDITPAMRARIKVSAFTQGVTVAEYVKERFGISRIYNAHAIMVVHKRRSETHLV